VFSQGIARRNDIPRPPVAIRREHIDGATTWRMLLKRLLAGDGFDRWRYGRHFRWLLLDQLSGVSIVLLK